MTEWRMGIQPLAVSTRFITALSVPCKESRPGLCAECTAEPTLKALVRPWETPARLMLSHCIATSLAGQVATASFPAGAKGDRKVTVLSLMVPGPGHPLGTPCVGCYMEQEMSRGQNSPSPSQTSPSQAHYDNCPRDLARWKPGRIKGQTCQGPERQTL